ncbi:uncharacterized protein C8A04DRAFT_8709 [Dichotomopilus funicola]|uniref:Mitochondrial distribution and morphology protein 12 n=1 Tax=Dichotomopilus funicola TaxID=1934379 RepID=A0AAN6ZQA9_9PEZI|nr:hypothetical protein C8A04DRAFT_8709 [Dichotomopilus funicola]
MSIDLNWETVTGGPDGQELADGIRDFIHTKFQSVPLPRFIKSVTVLDFQFGAIPPDVELKDITDPLPDFYEDNVESDLASDDSDDEEDAASSAPPTPGERRRRAEAEIFGNSARSPSHLPPHLMFGGPSGPGAGNLRNGVTTPGIPGGTSNLHYFHSHLASGLSGTQTPLAAVASAHHLNTANWLEGHGHGHSVSVPNLRGYPNMGGVNHEISPQPVPVHNRNPSQSSVSIAEFSVAGGNLGPPSPANLTVPSLREKHSVSTLAPTSAGTSRPPARDRVALMGSAVGDDDDDDNHPSQPQQQQAKEDDNNPRLRERRIDDMQAVFRIRYAGDVKLLLTADILLDYPMPSFVGIPVRLSITGLTFDGVGVLARIRKRLHFCFLSPEDAVAAVGNDDGEEDEAGPGGGSRAGGGPGNTKLGGLLQEIRVESEIGQRESGKQSLKNVGKVERFVLEQVRRIFEEEFVYPSFWTFLV